MAAFYLRYVETAQTVKGTPRLSDVFDTLTYRQRYEAMLDKAGRDSLTGLLDRGRFDSEGRSLVNDANMGKRSLSLMVIDIDRFRDFNERHGHAAGDEVLRQVAGLDPPGDPRDRPRLSLWRRGDRRALRRSRPPAGDARRRAAPAPDRDGAGRGAAPRSPPASALATAPLDGIDLASLLEAADRRLYEAKAAGRDRVVGRPDDDGSGNVTHFPRREQA